MRQSMALLIALAARPARALIPRLHRVPRAAVVRSMTEAPVNLVVDPETGEEMSKSALKKLQKQRKIDAKKLAKKQKAAEAAPVEVVDKGPPLVAARLPFSIEAPVADAPRFGDMDVCRSQSVWKSTSASGALSHVSAMAWPRWFRRAARNRHRHAIEQASRRWRGGRRCDSERVVKF